VLILKKIAITGGIGSGKSTVCQFLHKLGAYVVDSDEIVHKHLKFNKKIISDIKNLFGPEVFEHGEIDRKKLADLSFQTPEKLQKLEEIIHPIVFEEIEKEYQKVAKSNDYSYFVAEIPLYYEAKNPPSFDTVIVVTADESAIKKRIINSRHKRSMRVKRLIPLEEKYKKADYVIHNNGSFSSLKQQVKQIHNKLTNSLNGADSP
jgi:dephospho-CoA kinase